MNPPNTRFDKQHLHELASTVMDGEASENQRRQLSDLLRANPAARDEYLALVDLHATLATNIAKKTSTREAVSTREASNKHTRTNVRRILIPTATVAALAACLLVAINLPGPGKSVVPPDTFAAVSQSTAAVWDSGQFNIGNRIGPATMRLKSGLVQIEFDSGVEVTLEGPAEFKLADAAKTTLVSGLLTATVPPGAEGFTVDTPSARVIDLGTSFGIDLRNEGFENVSVFDGAVEIAARSTKDNESVERHLLTEGKAVRIGSDREIEDIRFDSKPFEKMWPFASGIIGSTETIRFVPPWPKQIRFIRSDDQIFLRPEGRRRELESELAVNISRPGKCAKPEDLSSAVLPTETTVRSYILHYSPETQLRRRRAKRVTGSITFDSPVLGIIVCHEELLASRHRFGKRSAGEANHRRELTLTGDDTGDRITLSQDMKTVTLDLISPGRSSDLIRVIVAKP